MIADAVHWIVVIIQGKSQVFQYVDGFQNGQAVPPSAAQVVDFAAAWTLIEFPETGGLHPGNESGRAPAFPCTRRSCTGGR